MCRLIVTPKWPTPQMNFTTVDGRNPANQLRLVVYPIMYDGFFTAVIPPDFHHQQYFKTLGVNITNIDEFKNGKENGMIDDN